jgi:hypothetical protein
MISPMLELGQFFRYSDLGACAILHCIRYVLSSAKSRMTGVLEMTARLQYHPVRLKRAAVRLQGKVVRLLRKAVRLLWKVVELLWKTVDLACKTVELARKMVELAWI